MLRAHNLQHAAEVGTDQKFELPSANAMLAGQRLSDGTQFQMADHGPSWAAITVFLCAALGGFFRGFVTGRKRQTSRVAMATMAGDSVGMDGDLKEQIDGIISDNKVVLFMKGTPMYPECGFSNTAIQILNSMNVPYHTVNVLEEPAIREAIKVYSDWPTIPQLYVMGEFLGGCDIMIEMYQTGELQETIEVANLS
jgi:monothiol glutaredoxin